MANLRKCSCCKSEIDISYFGINRQKEPYTTRDTCRSNKQKKRDALKRTDVDFIDKCINDELSVERFLTDNEYPCYDQVVQLIGNNLAMFSEYGEFNHNMMNKIWNDIHNTDKLKVIGRLINDRGGFTAMTNNHGALMTVVRHYLKQNRSANSNTIQGHIYCAIERAWDGIGEWKH